MEKSTLGKRATIIYCREKITKPSKFASQISDKFAEIIDLLDAQRNNTESNLEDISQANRSIDYVIRAYKEISEMNNFIELLKTDSKD